MTEQNFSRGLFTDLQVGYLNTLIEQFNNDGRVIELELGISPSTVLHAACGFETGLRDIPFDHEAIATSVSRALMFACILLYAKDDPPKRKRKLRLVSKNERAP